MSDADIEHSVECPICGGEFDPAVAGGWCTNPDCGEWQFTGDIPEADTASEPDETQAFAEEEVDYEDLLSDGETDDDTTAESSDSDQSVGFENVSGEDIETASADDVAESMDGVTTSADESPETTDETAEAAEAESADPAADDKESAVDAEISDDGETNAEPVDEPTEETATDAADAADAADAVDAADADAGDDAEEAAEAEDVTDEPEETAESDELSDDDTIDCPDCGTELTATANFCIECGADVHSAEADETSSLTECPACAAELSGDEKFCANCGEDLDAHRNGEPDAEPGADAVETLKAQSDDEGEADPVPESLLLSVRGREIEVDDGDHVGREIRAALTDAGRPEDEAVRIHREHVRFVRESDAFYLVDLGDNPTKLNGRTLQKGDREPVAPGDELELSGVATVQILAP